MHPFDSEMEVHPIQASEQAAMKFLYDHLVAARGASNSDGIDAAAPAGADFNERLISYHSLVRSPVIQGPAELLDLRTFGVDLGYRTAEELSADLRGHSA